jgi:hypothetical protein
MKHLSDDAFTVTSPLLHLTWPPLVLNPSHRIPSSLPYNKNLSQNLLVMSRSEWFTFLKAAYEKLKS